MGHITIVGLGLVEGDLTLRAVDALKSGTSVLVRTARVPSVRWLDGQQIAYESLDALYERAEDFDELERLIVDAVIQKAKNGDVLYAVADVRDTSVGTLLAQDEHEVTLCPGTPADAALTALIKGEYRSISASDWHGLKPDSAVATLIREIDTRELASELKLRLMERYPAAHTVYYQIHGNGAVQSCPLYELDRLTGYGYAFSALIPAVSDIQKLERYGFDDLNTIMRRLRGPGGCPWDQKQTHESIRSNVVEEAYEVVDAIDRNDIDSLYDELGDLLLQVTFHAEIARQYGEFGIDDVTTAVCSKLISRHPHIFGTAQADTPDEVLALWESVKKKEKAIETQAQVMRAVTKSLPALLRAEKVQKKAADVNFDWDNVEGALTKVFEEAEEVREALLTGEGLEEELGDLLFAVVNVARLAKVNAEHALMAAIDKFISRFDKMEERILADGKSLSGMTLPQMDVYWDAVKEEMRKTM